MTNHKYTSPYPIITKATAAQLRTYIANGIAELIAQATGDDPTITHQAVALEAIIATVPTDDTQTLTAIHTFLYHILVN